MRAITFHQYGGIDQLKLEEVSTPQPAEGEVLVRLKATSINDWDWQILQGIPFVNRTSFGLFRPKLHILGGDVAGVVEKVGPGANRFKQGDEVFGDLCFNRFGTFAEFVCAPEDCLAIKPAAMSFEQAAAIPQAGMLATQALFDVGQVRKGQKVLINGAGGGVGTFAIQLLKPYEVDLTVVDRADKLDRLIELGAHRAIDYQDVDFTGSGETYDLVIDTTTTRSPWRHARALEPGGVYVTVGGDTGKIMQHFLFGSLVRMQTGKQMQVVMLQPNKDLAFYAEQVEAGHVAPEIDSKFDLADLPQAMERFSQSLQVGKIIISMA